MAEIESSKDVGRFKYIEPTNMYLNLADNAITFPYEDYSIGVKLEVTIPDRFSCGRADGRTIEFSSNNGTIEFFGGSGGQKVDNKNKQGYLSTSFTDISANNVDRGNKECLGIESINISYQQWFYPIVNIRFVDVRGASLFMPQEKALQTTVASEGDSSRRQNITQVDGGSFFKAIFACPSPIFKLTVMGFYGKSVTFNLKMSSFQSEFDSENGNFIANVDFIGNMYGIYTEIPLQYLAVAPYLNMNYWNANKSGKFAFNENTAMMTFPEFWKAIEQIEKTGEKVIEKWKEDNKYNRIITKDKSLSYIKDTFNDVFRGWNSYKYQNQTYYFYVSEYKNGSDCINSARIIGLYQKIEDYNKEYDGSLPYLEFKPLDGSDISEEAQKAYYLKKYGKYSVENGVFKKYNNQNGEIITPNEVEKVNYKNLKLNTTNNTQFVFEFNTKLIEYIDELITNNKQTKEKKDLELEQYKIQEANNLLGFKLSIGNIFKMLFAHLDAFITEYYNTLSNIDSNLSDRTFSKVGITQINTDIPSNIKSLPPYPLIFEKSSDETDKNEVKWPSDVISNVILDETILVEKIIAASHNYFSAMTAAQNELNIFSGEIDKDLNASTDAMIPLTMYDFLRNDGGINPYNNAVDSDYNNAVEKIKSIFALRCLYSLYLYGGTKYANEKVSKLDKNDVAYVAWAEALNIRKAFGPNIDPDLINKLGFNGGSDVIEKSTEEFVKYLSTNGSAYWTTVGEKLINNKDKNGEYSLIKTENDLILPLKYNISEIKGDVDNGRVNDNMEYLHLLVPSANTNNFYVFLDNKNEDFFYDLKNGICQNAQNYSLPVKTKEVENFFQKFGKTSNEENQYTTNYNIYMLDKKDKFYKYKRVTSNQVSNDFENCISSRQLPNTTIGLNTLFNFVTYGCENIGEGYGERQGVFQTDFYRCQKNNYAQAYCFVFSNCLDQNSELRKKNTGKVPYIILLQEGAYYWREKNLDAMSYQLGNKNINVGMKDNPELIPVSSDNKFLSSTNERQIFKSWEIFGGKTDASNTRKEQLIGKFMAFAESNEFNQLKNYLEMNSFEIDKSDNKVFEMQSLFLSITERWGFIIDSSSRPDNKPIMTDFSLNTLKDTYKELLNNLSKIYDKSNNYTDKADKITGNQLEVKDGVVNDKHLKISTYLILKDLYDKYFSNMDKKHFMMGTKDSEFNKFLFMDSYYNDISDKLMINSSFITDLIKSITFNSSDAFNVPERLEKGMSVYEFMSEICQNHHMTFLALPQRFDVTTPRCMEEMFTPYTYKNLDDDGKENDGCYIGLYSYKPSQHLDIQSEQYAYKNDSFDITDGFDGAIPSALGSLELTDRGLFKAIPAFGVSYAKQNQSLFKKLNLSTSNQQITEQSIFATMDVAAKGNEGPRESTLYGQDLYRVYSSYAYQCTVEMMGNIQIMPLMYFQLNNIAMWHGAYMIISVEHNISPGDMTTRFTGVRINKNAIPLVDASIIFRDAEGNMVEVPNNISQTSGQGETGGNYTNPEIYDNQSNNYNSAKYRNAEEANNEKLNATWAVRSRFTATPQIAGYCARWTYNLADSFSNKTRESKPVKEGVSGGWGACDPGCHEAIRKLGYTLILEKHNISGQEIDTLIRNKLKDSYKYGDVMFYWSKTNDYGQDDLKHHAQFYAGDAYMPNATDYSPNVLGYEKKTNGKKYCEYNGNNCGWVTSTLNNYNTPFVYGGPATSGSHKGNTWHILLYRCNRLMPTEEEIKMKNMYNIDITAPWKINNPQTPLIA